MGWVFRCAILFSAFRWWCCFLRSWARPAWLLAPFWRHNTNSSGFTPSICFVQPIRVAHQEDWMIIFLGSNQESCCICNFLISRSTNLWFESFLKVWFVEIIFLNLIPGFDGFSTSSSLAGMAGASNEVWVMKMDDSSQCWWSFWANSSGKITYLYTPWN